MMCDVCGMCDILAKTSSLGVPFENKLFNEEENSLLLRKQGIFIVRPVVFSFKINKK